MQDKIEIGEYVRTKNGKIRKVENIVAQYYITYKINILDKNLFIREEIVKHSKNIINLIETGDYVNGYLVLDVAEDLNTGELHLEMQSNCLTPDCNCQLYNNDIKSIVTKEMMKSVEYRIE